MASKTIHFPSETSDRVPFVGNESDLRELVRLLEDFVTTYPEAEFRLLELFERAFTRPATSLTWETLHRLLQNYVGSELTRFLCWIVAGRSKEEWDLLERVAPSSVFSFLQLLSAYHEQDLKKAFALRQQEDEQWGITVREMGQDTETGRRFVTLEVSNSEGASIRLPASPDSFARLCRAFLEILRTVHYELGVSPNAVSVLKKEMEVCLTVFQSSAPEGDEKE